MSSSWIDCADLVRDFISGFIDNFRTSLNLEDYLLSNHRQLSSLQELVDKVLDIKQCRIEAGVKKISEMSLIEVPLESEQWTIDSFQEKTERRCALMQQVISNRSNLIEVATRDLIAEISKNVSPLYINGDIHLSFEAVYYNMRCLQTAK